ncbi:unnamed protein product, partial [Soboliphyme baturini]|uniref:Uncharacterized protein n=1 Tax=Soboliphyme baturini TaxID=241478 RepID=A0A183JAW1_9BILA
MELTMDPPASQSSSICQKEVGYASVIFRVTS